MTEGRCTGVPKIHNALEVNGSPSPIFQTDENHSFFLIILPIHPETNRKNNKQKPGVLKDKTHQLMDETHQLEPKTHQSPNTTHQNKTFLDESLPLDLKLKIDNLRKRPSNKELRSIISILCVWKPLTAQQIAEFLTRKDKKHLVRKYLTPLVKDGILKYVYPDRGNSPNQAYVVEK